MKKLIIILSISLLLTGCQNNSNVISDYEARISGLQQELEEAKSANMAKQESTEAEELSYPIIINYQENSGIRKYIGEVGIRVYPYEESPLVIEASQLTDSQGVLQCRAVVTVMSDSGMLSESWALVLMNDYGNTKAGYVPYKELEIIDTPIIKSTESLGSFHLGDRIEKMIGVLDQDYVIESENICMYYFYDEANQKSVSADVANPSIMAFVGSDFRITHMRTDSPRYELSSGFKVGDSAQEVMKYYEEHFEEDTVEQFFYSGDYRYRISETECIGFSIDTGTIAEQSVITGIVLYR